MSITSFVQYTNSPKQIVDAIWGTSQTANGSSAWISGWPYSGGSYAIGNTTNGIVPTALTPGAFCPIKFSANRTFISNWEHCPDQDTLSGGGLYLYDRLFHVGSFAFNANQVLSGQPSFASRVPNGDYSNLALFVECTSTTTGVLNVNVTYTDQDGNAGHSTGTVALTGGIIATGQIVALPFAPGDYGIQKIESVVASVATAGNFNLVIARRLIPFPHIDSYYSRRIDHYSLEDLGFPEIFNDSCLAFYVRSLGNACSHAGHVRMELVNG